MSMVNKVLAELKIDVKSDINAANITLIMIPRIPSGMIPKTNRGYAILEQLTGFWQMAWQSSGSTQPISSGYKTRLIIPGITIRNKGKTLIQPQSKVAPWACDNDFADKVFWTMIWSAHQYLFKENIRLKNVFKTYKWFIHVKNLV